MHCSKYFWKEIGATGNAIIYYRIWIEDGSEFWINFQTFEMFDIIGSNGWKIVARFCWISAEMMSSALQSTIWIWYSLAFDKSTWAISPYRKFEYDELKVPTFEQELTELITVIVQLTFKFWDVFMLAAFAWFAILFAAFAESVGCCAIAFS